MNCYPERLDFRRCRRIFDFGHDQPLKVDTVVQETKKNLNFTQALLKCILILRLEVFFVGLQHTYCNKCVDNAF